MNNPKMNATQTLAYLKKEAKDTESTKKHYRLKSEYYRIMYERSVTIEALEKALNIINK